MDLEEYHRDTCRSEIRITDVRTKDDDSENDVSFVPFKKLLS